MAQLVYRGGSNRDDNFTPRPGKDTITKMGVAAGLSVFARLELAAAPGDKAQCLDIELLAPPLQAFPDDLATGYGTEGHLSIAPVTADGTVDLILLEEWAATRGSGACHPLTDLVKGALVSINVRRSR
jgi:hypothetical protein